MPFLYLIRTLAVAVLLIQLPAWSADEDAGDWRESFDWFCPVEEELNVGARYHVPLPWHVLASCDRLTDQIRMIDAAGRQWEIQLVEDPAERMPAEWSRQLLHNEEPPGRIYLVMTAASRDAVRLYYAGQPALPSPQKLVVGSDLGLTNGTLRLEVARRVPAYAPELRKSLHEPLIWTAVLIGGALLLLAFAHGRFRAKR